MVIRNAGNFRIDTKRCRHRFGEKLEIDARPCDFRVLEERNHGCPWSLEKIRGSAQNDDTGRRRKIGGEMGEKNGR